MTLPMPSWVVTVLLQDDPLALNRAVGILRRRNLLVSSVSLGPASRVGLSRLTTILSTDEASVIRMGNALRKMVGILEVTVAAESEYLVREHALIRVRTAARELAVLLDLVGLYQASVLEELPSQLVLEVTAAPPAMVSFLRALEPFGVLDVVRSGAVALPHPEVSESAGRVAAPAQRVATAIPA